MLHCTNNFYNFVRIGHLDKLTVLQFQHCSCIEFTGI